MNTQNHVSSLHLEAMALAIPDVAKHPNRVPFAGILTMLDTPSDRAPAGAAGHRVVMPARVAEAALPSLLGMAVDYAPGLRGHDVRRKIGVITRAEIHGRKLEISGYLFGKDFPDVVRELRAAGRTLGMSYELADARVADVSASVWTLTDVTFTGAAILRRDKAAYSNTWIEISPVAPPSRRLSAGASRSSARGRDALSTAGETPALPSGESMKPEIEQQLITTSERLAQAAETLSATLTRLDAQHDELAAKIERIIAAVESDAGEEAEARKALEARVIELERANTDLKAQAERRASIVAARKTLPPLVTALLAKTGVEPEEKLDPATLDKTLASLSVEQRIAVKGQMARAGLID